MDFKKQLTTMFLISLAVIIVFGGAVLFLKSDIENRAKKIKNLKDTIVFNLNSAETMVVLQEGLDESKRYLPELQKYLIKKDQLLNLPKDISQSGRQNNLTSGLTFGEEISINGKEVRKTNFSLSLEGKAGMNDLINFLQTLENSNYFIKLSNIDYNQDGQSLRAFMSGQVSSF